MKIDIPLIIIACLLVLTLLLFVLDALPYPFGILILFVMLMARLYMLKVL
jgi:hypothetical protein